MIYYSKSRPHLTTLLARTGRIGWLKTRLHYQKEGLVVAVIGRVFFYIQGIGHRLIRVMTSDGESSMPLTPKRSKTQKWVCIFPVAFPYPCVIAHYRVASGEVGKQNGRRGCTPPNCKLNNSKHSIWHNKS